MTAHPTPQRLEAIRNAPQQTPAYVIDETALDHTLGTAEMIRRSTGCKVLFATKAFSFRPTLRLMSGRLDGLSVSSLFEARMAAQVTDRNVHMTSPAIREDDARELGKWCDFIAYNTYRQWQQNRETVAPHVAVGLRVNTRVSHVDDPRYNPCRPDSRLGEPIENLRQILDQHNNIDGILFHTNCESTEYRQLVDNVATLHRTAGTHLRQGRISWVNLGGGYLFEDDQSEPVDLTPLQEAISSLTDYGLEVYIEPGAALIRPAGNIVATVLEIQNRPGLNLAVLDTSVNHMPEVYEYQFQPYVFGHLDDGFHHYTLTGATCLAGDVFGQYRFERILREGDRVVFGHIGAYNLVKAHTFNGVNLPDIYHLSPKGTATLHRAYTYQDYADRWEHRIDNQRPA